MKKLKLVLIFLIFNFVAFSESLLFNTINNFAPFIWEEDGEVKGLDVDIVEEIEKRTGIEIEMEFLPWKRVLLNIEAGVVDGGFAGFRTSEREQYSVFSDYPMHYSSYSIVKNIDSSVKIDNSMGKTIGMRLGFVISDEFTNWVEENKIRIEESRSEEQNLRKLITNRVDFIISNDITTLYTAKLMGVINRLAVEKSFVEKKGSYIMLSKKSPKLHLLPKLNKVLKEIHEDGTYEEIIRKYTE